MKISLEKIEATVKDYLKETYLPPHRAKTRGWTFHDTQFFARGAEILSESFTKERASLSKNYFNKKEFRSGYLLYYLLPTFVKVWECLEKVSSHLGSRPLKILDLGCGPGSAALAASAFFRERPITIFGFEQNENIKKDALSIWKRFVPENHRLFFTREAVPRERFDMAIAANFLSELSFGQQIDLSTQALTHSSTFIIIEPALRKTTRDLMRLRDAILKERIATVLSPCLHQKNCPMLAANKRDWCHFYINWKCPQIIRDLDRIIGNKHDYLKMAYMIFRSGHRTWNVEHRTNLWRVVSSPLLSKGKKEFILCGANGMLKKITRLNRDRSPENAFFDRIHRGDVVDLENSAIAQNSC